LKIRIDWSIRATAVVGAPQNRSSLMFFVDIATKDIDTQMAGQAEREEAPARSRA